MAPASQPLLGGLLTPLSQTWGSLKGGPSSPPQTREPHEIKVYVFPLSGSLEDRLGLSSLDPELCAGIWCPVTKMRARSPGPVYVPSTLASLRVLGMTTIG